MGARVRIPLWVLLPGLAVSVVAIGAVAAGAIGIAGTRADLIRQADGNLLACAGQVLSRDFVAGPTSGPAPSGTCDMELLSASGQLLTPPAPGAGPGPAIPASPSWLAAHTARPATVPGSSGGSWRVLLAAVRYQPQRILFVGGPENVQYAISGPTGRGLAGWLVVMAGQAGLDPLTGRVAAGYAGAAGAVLVLLAVAGVAVTRAVLRPLRKTTVAASAPFATALTRVSEQMDASRTAEAAARRSAAETSERLSEVSLELRTSVSIVRGFAEYCRQRGKPPPPAGDPMARRVTDEVARIEALVARLDARFPHTPSAAG
jgi:hypothetical protein